MPEPRDPQLDELRRRARRRLVGAVVLALAAAVLVPMLLESDPRPLGEDVSVRIPPIDDGKFVSKVGEKAKAPEAAAAPRAEPTPAPTAATAAETPKPAPADAASVSALTSAEQRVLAPPARSTAKESTSAPAAETARTAASAPAGTTPKPDEAPAAAETAKAAAKPAPEPPKAGTFSVQLAAFIDDKGANALAGRLKKTGYPAYVEPYSTSRGTLWRVRVGPYPSREAAEAVRAKLKGDGQNGIITAAR